MPSNVTITPAESARDLGVNFYSTISMHTMRSQVP